jgi:hypothetical protein
LYNNNNVSYLKLLLAVAQTRDTSNFRFCEWELRRHTHTQIEREPARNNINELSIKAIDQFLLFVNRYWLCSYVYGLWKFNDCYAHFSWLFFVDFLSCFNLIDTTLTKESFSLMTKWPNLLRSSIRACVDEYLRSFWDNKTSSQQRRQEVDVKKSQSRKISKYLY